MSVANIIQYMYTKIVLRTWYLHYSLHFKNAQKCEEMIEIIWIHPCKINKKISMAFNKFKFYFRKSGMFYRELLTSYMVCV